MGAIEKKFERLEKEIAELQAATRPEKIRRIANEEIGDLLSWIAEKAAIDVYEEKIEKLEL